MFVVSTAGQTSAKYEVQQRGPEACQHLLQQLLEGVASDGASMLLVDLIPSRHCLPFRFLVSSLNTIFFAGRFSEWSKAIWKLQQGGGRDSIKYHYFGTVIPDEQNPALFRMLKEQTTAMIMKDVGFAERVPLFDICCN